MLIDFVLPCSYLVNLDVLDNAPKKEQAQLMRESHGLLDHLAGFRSKVKRADPASPWFHQLRSLDQPGGALDQYKTRLDELAILLTPKVGSRSLGKHLFWSHDKRIRDALTVMERLKSLISIALQEDNL